MDDDRLISLNAAIDAIKKCTDIFLNNLPPTIYKEDAIKAVKAQPSATDTNVATTQPKYDEWCTDCREYDHERHSCPRWNRVIRQTVEDMKAAQPGWTYIEEALPETIINEHTHDYQEYNCLCDFGEYGFDVRTYKFGNGHFWNGGGIVDKYVTAWQPLPEIPDALKPQPWEGVQDES